MNSKELIIVPEIDFTQESNPCDGWINEEDIVHELAPKTQLMKTGQVIVATDGYKSEYDQICFDTMAEDSGSMVQLCANLKISKETVKFWLKRHKNFAKSFENGKIIGESKFRKKIVDHAFVPGSRVNNGLIQMLAKNIYGIDFDESPSIVINNNNGKSEIGVKKESSSLYEQVLNGKLISSEIISD